MKEIVKSYNIYTILLMLSLAPFVPDNTFLSIGIYYTTIALGIYYFVKVMLMVHRAKFINALMAFFIVMSLYGVFRLLGQEIHYDSGDLLPASFFIKNILYGTLPIFAYYYFSTRGLLTRKWLISVFVIAIALSVARYYDNAVREAFKVMRDENEITNNIAYEFVALLPFLVLLKEKQFYQAMLMLTLLFFIITGLKRGAILTTVVCLMAYFFYNMKGRRTNQKILFLLLFGVTAILVFNYVQDFYANNEYFQRRVMETEEGNTSSRNIIYSRLIRYFTQESTPLQLIVGSGADTTVKVAGNFAHQDWLELAVNCGLIGIILYLVYWIAMWKDLKRVKNKDNDIFMILLLCGILMFIRSLFSMNYADMMLGTMIALGYAEGQVECLDIRELAIAQK